ncbi:MAG: PTS sugar transporter subunit IIA [Spirochaetales bacterium]|nr:PTS sugar transporter subunit IIA [Spirochaetales bacterium]
MLKYLNPNLIRIDSKSDTKEEIIVEISDMVGRICPEATSGEIYRALNDREKLSSTSLGKGIAIPHCTLAGVKDFYIGLIRVQGIDFNSLDGENAKLIFFSVGPKNQQKKHISTLTAISKIGLDKELLNSILTVKTSEEIYSLLKSDEDEEDYTVKKCQFVIHVQDEDVLNSILEILTSDSDGAISVIDADSPGAFLNKLPLFSSFWNDISERFNKIVVAIVDKRLMNETIRKINLVNPGNESNLCVTVTDLLYFNGSLEY